MSLQSCDVVYLADRASASDQGHDGKAAIALHALVLLPGIHHLAHHLDACTTCTTFAFFWDFHLAMILVHF